jgi:hypothetical protein
MLHNLFHLDVVKLDQDVTCIAMDIHTCFKRMFYVFHLFQTYVACVSYGCFKSKSGEHVLQWRRWLADKGLHSHGSPCRRLRPTDTSAMRNRRWGR